MPKPEVPRSFEVLREDAKQVANQLKDLPVNAWAERNNALMRLANVVVELIDRVQQKEKTEGQSSDNN